MGGWRGWLGLGVALVPTLGLAWRMAYVCDDAYIAGRYARSLADGHGLRFNPGEAAPVEGYSDLLWVLIGAALEALGLRSPEALVGVSVGAAVLTLVLVWRVLVRDVGTSASAATAAVAVLSAFPPFAAWTSSGLEAMPAALAMTLVTSFALAGRTGRDVVVLGLSALALALLRSEGALWDAALLGGLWALRPGQRAVVGRAALLALAGLLPVELWRLSTYGTLVPHVARVKVVVGPALWLRGVAWVALASLTWLTPLLALGGGRLRHDPRWPAVAPFFAAAAAVVAFGVAVGGDYMPFHRFLLPAWPLLAVPLGLWIDRVAAGGAARAVGLVAALVLVGGLPLANVTLAPRAGLYALQRAVGTRSPVWRSDLWQVDKEAERSAARLSWARAIARVVPPGAKIVARGVGALGYETELFVLDAHGLVTAEVVEEGSGRMIAPGHDRRVQRGFFMGHVPDVLFAFALRREAKGEIADVLPYQWGIFEDLGPDEAIYVADLVDVPGKDPALPKELLLVRLLREGEDPELLRDRFKEQARRLGYRVPPLEPLDERRRAVALAKRHGGEGVRELLREAGHRPGAKGR